MVGLVVSWVDRKLRDKPLEGLQRLARELGLELDAPERKVCGVIDGIFVEVSTDEGLRIRVTPSHPAEVPRIRAGADITKTGT